MKKNASSGRQMSDTFRMAIFIILSGGFQDAYTYFMRGEVFANAQTGNIVLMGAALFKGEWSSCVKYLIPLLSFMVGIAAAEFVHAKYKYLEGLHWRQIVLICEIVLLFVVGFLPHNVDMLANALVSFVCALQVQTFRKVHGRAYASTMCIGNMRSGMEALCEYFRTKDKAVLKKSLLFFAVILIFAIGAGIGSLVVSRLYEKSIWISCALLIISFIIMFIPENNSESKTAKYKK